MELAALLKDSHTFIIPPWGCLIPGYDILQLEIQVIDDKFYIAQMGDTEEFQSQRIYPILEIGDNCDYVLWKSFSELYNAKRNKTQPKLINIFSTLLKYPQK